MPSARWQVQRQALRAEGGLNVSEQGLKIHLLSIDLVHNDHATQTLFACGFHHAPGHQLDTGLGIDDDGGRIGGRLTRTTRDRKNPGTPGCRSG